MKNSKKELLALFDRMEAERQTVLKTIEYVDHSILETKPNTESWSVSEVIMHMVVAEGGALAYMRKKIEVNNHQVLKGGTARLLLLVTAIKAPIKYKAPKIVADVGSDVPLMDALKQWDDVRTNMRKEYENMNEDWIGHDLFKHPAAGKFNLIQAIKFMTLHANRHLKQIGRTAISLEAS